MLIAHHKHTAPSACLALLSLLACSGEPQADTATAVTAVGGGSGGQPTSPARPPSARASQAGASGVGAAGGNGEARSGAGGSAGNAGMAAMAAAAGMTSSAGGPGVCEQSKPCCTGFVCGKASPCAAPPEEPPNAPPGDGSEPTVLAIRHLWLGDSAPGDLTYAPDPNAWRYMGFDLDGYASTWEHGCHCRAHEGAKNGDIREDGAFGRDNSFGRNVAPILSSYLTAPAEAYSHIIGEGTATLLLRVDNLGSGPQQRGLTTSLLRAAGATDAKGEPIATTDADWINGTYTWHPFVDQVTPNGKPTKPATTSYLSNQTLVADFDGEVDVTFVVGGWLIPIKIEHAIVTARLADDHRSATSGVIAGTIDAERFVTGFRQLDSGGLGNPCDVGAMKGLYDQIRQAADIMVDGSQDPTQICNAITVAIGFEAFAAQQGEPRPVAEQIDPCAE